MKAIVIGRANGASPQAIMALYPKHKAVVDVFVARGEVLGIAVSRTKQALRALRRSDEPDWLWYCVRLWRRDGIRATTRPEVEHGPCAT